jgi:hypothetical protein
LGYYLYLQKKGNFDNNVYNILSIKQLSIITTFVTSRHCHSSILYNPEYPLIWSNHMVLAQGRGMAAGWWQHTDLI